RRELDFYIKNEVMHLDDIEHESAPKVEQYLSQIKVIRSIAHKIIQFLEQLENFQKKLWLKKKFVIETNYCITLDRVPEELYPEIAKNDAQREEWVKLFAIDEIKKDSSEPGYTKPLKSEFLKANPSLVLDTRHFCQQFITRLLAVEGASALLTDSLLVQSDNFHALYLIHNRFEGCLGSVYIDPPYNTTATEILYKNDYKHSSWLSFISSRLRLAMQLLSGSGIICVTIDDVEYHRLQYLLEQQFGADNHLGTAAIRNNPQGRSTVKGFRITHEYASFFSRSEDVTSVGRLERSEEKSARWDQTDENGRPYLLENFRKTGTDSRKEDRPKQFYPLYFDGTCLRIPKMEWSGSKDEWEIQEKPTKHDAIFWPIDGSGQKRVWKWGQERVLQYPQHISVSTPNGGEPQVYCRNYMNEEGKLPSTWWDEAKYAAGSHGTNLLTDTFGVRVFDFPKSVYAVEDCLRVTSLKPDGFTLDFFGGSGTTAHAVLNLNRADSGNRKYILAEVGHHFDSALLPRVKKFVYSAEWKDGKPSRTGGVSHAFKYIRLESYEDALNNLELKRSSQQELLLDADAEMREQYTLAYMLDVESRGSQSLLNVEAFRNPDEYKLRVERNGETQLVNVDLVETFNWLLGLTVKHIDVIRGVRVVEGTAPNGDRVLVLWRNIDQMDNDALDKWFEKQDYNTREMVYDVFYVNGDNNLENLRRLDQTWKVRLIEEEFKRLMFDVEDV
ncbi:MAG: site-specific DNA-methyltransferase, partial [Pirellula sp.]